MPHPRRIPLLLLATALTAALSLGGCASAPQNGQVARLSPASLGKLCR